MWSRRSWSSGSSTASPGPFHSGGLTRIFRLNFGQLQQKPREPDDPSLFQIYVGNLDQRVTEEALKNTFKERYPSVAKARIVEEPGPRKLKRFGFVLFGDERESKFALTEMNGFLLGMQRIKTGESVRKSYSNLKK
jgi:RNA recognition motif-containing protein